MWQHRAKRLFWGTTVLATMTWGCETSRTPGGFIRDIIPPTITLTTSADTQQIASGLTFTVSAADNLALNDVSLTYSGGYLAQTDTIFRNQTLTSYTQVVTLTPAQLSGAGGQIVIAGRATDGAGNTAVDTLRLFLVNIQALKVILVQPSPGAVASTGKYVPIQVIGVQRSGVQKVGWTLTPPTGQTAAAADSVYSLAPPFADSINFVDSVLVTGQVGTFTVTGFAVDSGNRRRTSSPVIVNIQSAANDTTPPQIQQFVPLRAEATDTITVHATDPSGISVIGFKVTDITGATLLHRDSVLLSGKTTDVTRTFSLGLSALSPPVKVVVQAFACDSSARHNCGVTGLAFTSPSPPGPSRSDTVLIVSGTTRGLPLAGSTIVDAIFNKNAGTQGELYLTNPAFSRVEIFQVANSSFVAAGVPTAGPQPWGIALWPHDTLGNYGDTIVVANAGGTELSIIDMTPTSRVLRWRQDLPNFLIETFKVVQTPAFKVIITVYPVSSRPQYVATVCRATTGSTACASDSIYAIYATTPEPSNPAPFTGKATLRMEKLINSIDTTLVFGHLFWEIANIPPSNLSDTLRIEEIRFKPGVPGYQDKIVLSACAGVNVNLSAFGLGDTTFARNSGNFTHGFFGEGGRITAAYARVMAYTTAGQLLAGPSTFQSCSTGGPTGDAGQNDHDFGMSPAVNVNDFIANTATRVRAIATNFNGLTNVARADSEYYLDQALRLKATSPDSGTATGIDMNYNHTFGPSGACAPTCGGTGSPNDRILFAARFDANIDVFDTYFGRLVSSIPIRDPIIGPLRVAKDPFGNQLLFGITARGLVTVRLAPIFNPPPAPPR
jgi:hypothetical protein